MSKIVRTQPAKAGQQITVTDAQGRSFQSEAIGEIVDDKGVAFQVDGQWKVAGNSNSKQQSRTTIERHQPKKKTEVALYPFIRLYLSDSKGYKDGDGYKGKMIDQNLLFVIGGVNLGKGRDKFILIGYDNNTQSWFLKAGSSLINMSPTLTEVQEALLETSYYYLGHKFLKPKEANNLIVYPSLISEISNGSYGLLRKNRDDAYQKNDANINTPYLSSGVYYNYQRTYTINHSYSVNNSITGVSSNIHESGEDGTVDGVPVIISMIPETTPWSYLREIDSNKNYAINVSYNYNIVSCLLSDNSSVVTGIVTGTETGSSNYSQNYHSLIEGVNEWDGDLYKKVTNGSSNEDEMPYSLTYSKSETTEIDIQLPDGQISLNNTYSLLITESGNYQLNNFLYNLIPDSRDQDIQVFRSYSGSDSIELTETWDFTNYDSIIVFDQSNYILIKYEKKGNVVKNTTVSYTPRNNLSNFIRTNFTSINYEDSNSPTGWYAKVWIGADYLYDINFSHILNNPTNTQSNQSNLTSGYFDYGSLNTTEQITAITIGNTTINTSKDFSICSNNTYSLFVGSFTMSVSSNSYTFIGNQKNRIIYTVYSGGDEDWFFANTESVFIYSGGVLAEGIVTSLAFQNHENQGNVYKKTLTSITINITAISNEFCAAEYMGGTVIFTRDKCFNFIRSLLEYKKTQENLINLGSGLGKKINLNAVIDNGIPSIYIAEKADESVKSKKNIKIDVYRLNGTNFSRQSNKKGDIGKREKTSNSNSEFWLYYK